MTRCPYLGLEEEGTTPFPFSSSSHHCYVSKKGLRIDQQEQERYCLAKRYTSCPLFLSQSSQEGLADRLPEAVVKEEKPEVVLEPPLRETVEPLAIEERLADKPVEAVVKDEKPEPVVEAPLKERVEPLPIREGLVDKPVEALVEEKLEVVVEAPLKERLEPLPIEEGLADKVPKTVAEGEKPQIVMKPSVKETQKTGPRAISVVFKALPWIGAGVVFLTLLCVSGVIVFRVLTSPPEIAFPSFSGLPSLWPGALLLVSVISFAGAVLLLGLFLWTRRAITR